MSNYPVIFPLPMGTGSILTGSGLSAASKDSQNRQGSSSGGTQAAGNDENSEGHESVPPNKKLEAKPEFNSQLLLAADYSRALKRFGIRKHYIPITH